MRDLLDLAKFSALQAGAEILKHYEKYDLFTKTDKSPLTSADLASNKKIFEILGKSGIKISSEEQILSEVCDEFWLVDPLDGTKEFIDKNGEFCVCIALIKHGTPVLGVIFIPCENALFYASENGAFRVDLNTQTSIKLGQNDEKIFYLSRRSAGAKSTALANHFGFKTQKIGSAIKFCRLVQNGGIYARFSPSYIWDNAAGDALVRFSGGAMISLKQKTAPTYDLTELKNPHFIALSHKFLVLKDEIFERLA
ncbi:3'(2'),5'-bisphosphate nucleotidase CysQ family protein [Campylobacter gastrosuis]|uniref:3'(2'),5'-bisphosphate nucleotidase CysQ n=1 Tax=Campylobacter gastrosuis TaxID=2974576 RepID=A0ABT7HQ30_9BACT|nr:3'(2'),5'-bisphosphate nucleotidase CysQ [Campylobacter gastrosuis]MDL0088945.1 3'(2'),5'-bisphosphate nucleotidase CysQ [Campylobacter gastrosuis]